MDIVPWLAGPLATACACLLAARLGRALRLVDHPDNERKRHEQPTPLIGGVAVMLPWTGVIAAASLLDVAPPALFALAAVAMAFFVVGLADDRAGLDPGVRLLAGVVIMLATAMLEPSFSLTLFIASHIAVAPLPATVFGLLLTVVAVVGLVNAVNMADGLNGLVPGLWAIWLVGLLVYAPPALVPFYAILLACVLLVLLFNCCGRLFLGDSGAYAAASVVGLSAIYLYNSPEAPGFKSTVAVAWFLIPVLDCLRLIGWRLGRRRSAFTADRHHLHHRLERRFGTCGAVLTYWLIVGLPVAVTLWPALRGFGPILLAAALYLGALYVTSRKRCSAHTSAGFR